MCVASPAKQKLPSMESLKSSQHPPPVGETHGSGGGTACYRRYFLFLTFLYNFYLFLILSINPNLLCIVVSNLVLILFIFNFFFLTLLCKIYLSSILSFNLNL